MNFQQRFIAGVVIVLGVWLILATAECRRLARAADTGEREAWAEVCRLRATLTAHGIDVDAMETNLIEPETTPQTTQR